MSKPSPRAYRAAEAIIKRYRKWLIDEGQANQDYDCCLTEIAEIVSMHCDVIPDHIAEALNSGNGTYKP